MSDKKSESMQFGDHKFALKFRDWLVRSVQREFRKTHPPDAYGTVLTVDYINRRASISFADRDEGATRPFGANVQPTAGQTVRVCGRASNRYIAAVVSLPVWQDPVMEGAWVAGSPVPQFRRDVNGNVRMRGVIANGTASTAAFTLPVGYVPSQAYLFAVPKGTTSFARVDVRSDGAVVPRDTSSAINLDGVIFDAN